jgi:hypothetical protein
VGVFFLGNLNSFYWPGGVTEDSGPWSVWVDTQREEEEEEEEDFKSSSSSSFSTN